LLNKINITVISIKKYQSQMELGMELGMNQGTELGMNQGTELGMNQGMELVLEG